MPTSFSVLQPDDIDEVVALLGSAFAKRDPPAIAVGMTVPEFEQFVRVLSPTATADKLTIVARDSSTRKLVGVLLAEDSASKDPDGMEQISPKFEPIFEILEMLGQEYWTARENRAGQTVHMFLLGVSKEAAGKGIATQLVRESLRNASAGGYTRAVTEATNRTSQHIFQKCGFQAQCTQSYASFRHNGAAVFESISDEVGPSLMDFLMPEDLPHS